MTNIRKLWWYPDIDTGGRLISMLAPNLEHIRVQYKDQSATAKTLSFPPMQRLESAEVTLEYEWMLPFYARLESILAAAPDSLTEICITFAPRLRFLHQTALAYEWMLPFYARLESILAAAPDSPTEICITFAPRLRFLHQTALARMDNFLADRGASPRIRWRLDVDDNTKSSFTDFVGALEQGLPRLDTQGKLLVERRSVIDSGFSDWAIKR
ncbi:hypothetical protein B0H16DRAFT_1573840 [Mycena metata]|uniref:Uncharacterized protein n=1 Tax=Mycena metata TaxID=1033252 RepID=A0AAD7MXK4_9AGAR|nr:hypothetical protein B0H16DRAFT_1573840 [Mycena metata]